MKRYGGSPLHLLAQLVAFALAGYAASRVLVEDAPWLALLVWFVGAALGHDLVLYPLYALADTATQFRPFHRGRPLPAVAGVPWINHLRVPVGLSLLLLLVWWPLILSDAPGTFTAATGLTTGVYLGRWLGISGMFLLVSAVAYAVRLRRARRPSPGGLGAPGRRIGLWGAAVGLAAGLLVATLLQVQGMLGRPGGGGSSWAALVASAAAVGAAIGLLTDRRLQGLAAAVSGGAMMGLLGWLLLALTLGPLLHGTAPTWTVAAATTSYRELIGAVLYGALTGGALHGLRRRWLAPSGAGADPAPRLSRVVIIGGGFAGVGAARRLERLVLRGAPVDVTVVSESNFLLFTPMLAEVASGALEAAHISAPVRSAVAHTRFRHGTVDDVDTDDRTVLVGGMRIPYDHLVIAVGSVPSFLDLPGVEENAFTMKDLADATRLRDHAIGLLERCDQVIDRQERERLLTFVVAGGGFAGAETVAELFDLVHSVLYLYPGITADEPRFVLVHSRDRILPELSPELGAYALSRLRRRGIGFRLGRQVSAATGDGVRLDDGTSIATATLVWAAGTRPSPLVTRLPGEHARNGALVTDPTFRVTELDGVWAIGDCARVPDVDRAGAPFPPTAQHAQREGRVVADNIAAVIAGREPAAFRFRTVGVLVALGHRTAAAEIRGRRFSGVAAWLMWRGIYLAKLPGAEKRARVLLDWLLDLVFPRDVVVTTDVATADRETAASSVRERGVEGAQQ